MCLCPSLHITNIIVIEEPFLYNENRCNIPTVFPLRGANIQVVHLPNDSSRDEEEDGAKEEGEALEEVQRCWVDGVEEAASHQRRQTLHTGYRGKQGTWNQKYMVCRT